ncbi:hypothetical protein HY358_02380 [Candidatus Roizmanbacteria bacterium]|nr:hypothetical protein [Candidatus Roizmanbacteria bacterium]
MKQQKNNRLSFNKILLFLFVLFLPTQLGRHFFFPFSYLSGVRIDYLAPTLYFTDIIALLLIVSNVQTVLRFFRSRFTIIFLALISLNIFFSLIPAISFYKFLKLLEFLALFAIYAQSVISPKLLLAAFAIGGGVEGSIALSQFVTKHSLQGLLYFFGERYFTLSTPDIAKASLFGVEILRPYGTFSHPNSLAGFYLLPYFFVLLSKRFQKHLILKYTTLFLSSFIIFLSFSKVAILIYLIGTVVYLIGNTFYRKCILCFTARILILTVLTGIIFAAQGDFLSAEKRILLLQNAGAIIITTPLFGVGLGSYLAAQHEFAIKYPYFFLQPVHNIFALLMAEAGIILGGFLFLVVGKYLKIMKKNRAAIFLVAVIAFTGLFDHYWLTLQQNFLLIPVVFGILSSDG